MARALYMDDCYLKEFEAEIKSVSDGKYVVLDQTAFYPSSGGQANDIGVLIKDGREYRVVFVGKFNREISHEVSEEGLKDGDKVIGKIDWDRRYKLMRMHTASHIMSAIFHKEIGALITGNQLKVDKSRIDFNLENFDRDKIDEYIKKSNEIVEQNLPIKIFFISRSEAEKEFSLQEIRILNGIIKTNLLNFGINTKQKQKNKNISEYIHYFIGQNLIYGDT